MTFASSTHAIDVRSLRKAFGAQVVLDDLDLVVRRGEVFALLGPNGAGKTTTINVLTTLTRPDAGSVQVAGVDVVRHPDDVKRRISLTGQATAVDDVLTGLENVTMLGRLSGLTPRGARRRATELLERFDLADAATKRVGAYSGGMRRRLDLALSFIVAPEVLFLVVGANKAEAARRAFAEPPSQATPASLVRSRSGRTVVILDPAAAEHVR